MKNEQRYCGVGGQAVMEGVMMKNKDRYAVAVRKSNGEIAVETGQCVSRWRGTPLPNIPFVRGIFVFIDSMILGMKSLNISASYFEEEEEEKELSAAEKEKAKKKEDREITLTMIAAFVLAIGVFMILPYYLSTLFARLLGREGLAPVLEGILRLLIFIGYMLAVSLMKEVRRVFEYHGAEHKCINCIETGKELTVENARESSRFHRRCGTSFILIVVIISILVFLFIRVDSRVLRIALRILLLPVISGIAYEIIRLAGKTSNPLIDAVSAPGLFMQRITTKEPDDSMLEVAIASVNAVFDWKTYQDGL